MIGNTPMQIQTFKKKPLSNFAAEATQLKGVVLQLIIRVFAECGIKAATIVVKNTVKHLNQAV
jgi:hypothetical protein